MSDMPLSNEMDHKTRQSGQDFAAGTTGGGETAKVPHIEIEPPHREIDMATVLGLFFAVGLIGAAILMGDSGAQFFNGRALVIVLLGTIAVTCISFTPPELAKTGSVLVASFFPEKRDIRTMGRQLLDIAVTARLKTVLSLNKNENELARDPYLKEAIALVVDGFKAEDIEKTLYQELETQAGIQYRSAAVLRRASEIAPAMGLIGTLLGLVQMLANLNDPSAIGPAMATALLTTFYGAVLGTVILAPLADKLEKNAQDEALVKQLVIMTMKSICEKVNPRQLEIQLNSELPPGSRIRYF